MPNEATTPEGMFVDNGDGWRHFDKRALGRVVGLSEGAAHILPANNRNTIEQKKNQK